MSRGTRFLRGGALVFEFTGTIGGSAACGWAFDRWFGTDPWGLIVLSVIGAVAGFARLLQLLRRFDELDRAQRQRGPEENRRAGRGGGDDQSGDK